MDRWTIPALKRLAHGWDWAGIDIWQAQLL
jgi:hypothetical protein